MSDKPSCSCEGDEENPCEDEECQTCCTHEETDHGVCMSCGYDCSEDIGARAYDRYKDSMKYGEQEVLWKKT